MIAAHGMAAASVARSFAAPTLRSPCCCLDGARPQDVSLVKRLVQEHLRYTGSEVARRILLNWERERRAFVKVCRRQLLASRKALQPCYVPGEPAAYCALVHACACAPPPPPPGVPPRVPPRPGRV